jgi:hypothetical protein
MRDMIEAQTQGGTLVAVKKSLPTPPVPVQELRRPSQPTIYPYSHLDDDDDDDDDDDATGTLWKCPPQALSPNQLPKRPASPSDKAFRTGVADFTRPPAEDVYERLDKFFPAHDLDKPVIDASSGGTSPTSMEPPPLPLPSTAPPERFKHKKSIRVVAAEHKRRIKHASIAPEDMRRKRSTKLWGSKLEEVTPAQAQAMLTSNIPPESPSTAAPKRRSHPWLFFAFCWWSCLAIFKWVRGELIGKGTYGRVYLALNATTGEMIAVKQVEIPQTASDKEDQRQVSVVEALKSESETLKDLDHPHIVQYLGFEETPKFLSMWVFASCSEQHDLTSVRSFLEYVPGGSVGSCIRKHGAFSENVTKSFTAQILEGLEYLHTKGILHRVRRTSTIR